MFVISNPRIVWLNYSRFSYIFLDGSVLQISKENSERSPNFDINVKLLVSDLQMLN